MRGERQADFSQPIGADFVVSLRAKNKEYCLFVQSFIRRNGKSYLRHTTEIAEAKRFSRIIAEEVVEQVKDYRCHGRVERVSYDNKQRWEVPPLGQELTRLRRGEVFGYFLLQGAKTPRALVPGASFPHLTPPMPVC